MTMFTPVATFSGFSVDDIDVAKKFYTEVLDLEATDQMGGFSLALPNGAEAWVYAKPNHAPAAYTMLNFVVDDIDAAVDQLNARGITFERYGPELYQDDKGIARGKQVDRGPNIAWFTDPAGNIIAVLEP